MFNLFRRIDEPKLSLVEALIIDHHIEDGIPLKTFEDDRFRVKIFKGNPREDVPNPSRILVVEFRGNVWRSMFGLHEGSLPVMMNVLDEVRDFLGELNGPRRLRTVQIADKRYFVDDRLMQLRNVDHPDDFIDIPRGAPWN